jgi:hypothetical protein
MRYFLLLLICSISFTAEVINPVIKSTLDSYEAEAAKAYADYLKATSKAADKANSALDSKLKAAMKANNLDLATVIKKQMEDLSKGKTLANLEATWKEPASSDSLLGNSTDLVIGKWGNGTAVMWDFKADGTGIHYWSGSTLTFKWIKSEANYSVTVQGHGPRICTFIDKNTIQLEPGTSIRMK